MLMLSNADGGTFFRLGFWSLSVAKQQDRLKNWGKLRSGGVTRYILVHGAVPWGLLLGPFCYFAMSLLFQFEIFSLAGFFRLSSCLLFFSYCGGYFAWHRWRTEETIWQSSGQSSSDAAQDGKAPIATTRYEGP